MRLFGIGILFIAAIYSNTLFADACSEMGNDINKAKECMQQKIEACAKSFLPKIPKPTDNSAQAQCFKNSESALKSCGSGPNSSECVMNAYKALQTCISKAKLPEIPIGQMQQYQNCVTAAVAALGTFYLHANNSIYDYRYRLIDEMRRAGCNPDGNSWVCTTHCQKLNACVNRNMNNANSKICEMCYNECKMNPDFCKNISNGTQK